MGEAHRLLRFHFLCQLPMANVIGTSTHAPTGVSPRRAGTNLHWRTVFMAASSRLACPLDVRISTCVGSPCSLTNTLSTTFPCSPIRRESAGYIGGGLLR